MVKIISNGSESIQQVLQRGDYIISKAAQVSIRTFIWTTEQVSTKAPESWKMKHMRNCIILAKLDNRTPFRIPTRDKRTPRIEIIVTSLVWADQHACVILFRLRLKYKSLTWSEVVRVVSALSWSRSPIPRDLIRSPINAHWEKSSGLQGHVEEIRAERCNLRTGVITFPDERIDQRVW